MTENGVNTVTMTQEDLNKLLIAHNLRGYVRGVRHISDQLRGIADSLEISCQEIEKQWRKDNPPEEEVEHDA